MKQLKQLLLLISCFHVMCAYAQDNIIKIDDLFKNEIEKKLSIDTSCKILLKNIIVTGNKKTKEYIVCREMNIKTGDSVRAADLYEKLRQSRELIYNTNLFSIVELEPLLTSAYEFDIRIRVIERWYIYPAPQFRLMDRNLNEWYHTYHADLNRVNYGMKFTHYNLSGRGDQMNIIAMNGLSRNFYVSYLAPYSNPKLTEGFSFSMNFSQSKEIIYNTTYNNQYQIFRNDSFCRTSANISASYRKRKGFYNRQLFEIHYNYVEVHDSILTTRYNPGIFNLPQSHIAFPDFIYSWQYTKVDNVNYPQKGKMYSFSAVKRGWGWKGGVNLLSLDVSYRKYYPLRHKLYYNMQFLGRIRLPLNQPYANRRMMGNGDFYLNGLEYYVIDGTAAFISKFTLSKKLTSFRIPLPFKLKQFPYLPFSIYAKTYAHFGYNYIPQEYDSRLNNRFLYTGGAGIDILTLYDLKMSVEFSWNQLGEKGLFLHSGKL